MIDTPQPNYYETMGRCEGCSRGWPFLRDNPGTHYEPSSGYPVLCFYERADVKALLRDSSRERCEARFAKLEARIAELERRLARNLP
jgi:hypothetical protein